MSYCSNSCSLSSSSFAIKALLKASPLAALAANLSFATRIAAVLAAFSFFSCQFCTTSPLSTCRSFRISSNYILHAAADSSSCLIYASNDIFLALAMRYFSAKAASSGSSTSYKELPSSSLLIYVPVFWMFLPKWLYAFNISFSSSGDRYTPPFPSLWASSASSYAILSRSALSLASFGFSLTTGLLTMRLA